MMRRFVPRLQAGARRAGSAVACKEPGWTYQPDHRTSSVLQPGKEMIKFV